jgi:hypothetical protein
MARPTALGSFPAIAAAPATDALAQTAQEIRGAIARPQPTVLDTVLGKGTGA